MQRISTFKITNKLLFHTKCLFVFCHLLTYLAAPYVYRRDSISYDNNYLLNKTVNKQGQSLKLNLRLNLNVFLRLK